jgi:23S rRNA pseudouridine1911/1915/1917 synthase
MNDSSRKNYSATADGAGQIELSVPTDCAGLRLDQALARMLPQFSRTRLARWVERHQVTVDGSRALPRHKVWGGERVSISPTPDPCELAPQAEQRPLDVVYEDDAILVINKPPGLVVHPGSGNWSGTLLNALLAHAPHLAQVPRAGIVHRLDKDTSGLLVVAKTLAAHAELVRQLQARTVSRVYLAVVHGQVARSGVIEAPVGRHPTHRTRMAVVARGKPAVTHYEVLSRHRLATVLRCRLESGRTHQIRVHLDSIGHPIVGDPVYGARRAAGMLPFHRQALHAERLELTHPVTRKRVAWHASPPADIELLLQAIAEHT